MSDSSLNPGICRVGAKTANWMMATGILVVAIVFSFGITGGHIGLDDWGYTSGCPFVAGGLNFSNLSRAFRDTGYGAIWMPVTFASYMIDVSLFGDNWYAYHAVNVLLHLVNTWLVFKFLERQCGFFVSGDYARISAMCAVGALLWALHPTRAEGVTFVASRKEELWTLFSLCGLLQYGVFLRDGRAVRYAAAFACFALAGMSKPTAVCFPFLAVAMHVVARRRGSARSYVWILPMVVAAIALGWLTVNSQSHPSNGVSVDVYEASLAWRMLNAAVSTGLYVWYTFVPLGVHMDYMAVFGGWPVDGWLGLCVLAISVVLFAIVVTRTSPQMRDAALYCATLFFISLGPTLGVFGYVNGDQAMADRYLYFPHIATALAAAVWLARRAESTARFRRILVSVLSIVAIEGAVAVPVVKSYETGFTACSRVLEKDPSNWRALRIVGNEYCARMNKMDEGIAMLRKSLAIHATRATVDSLAYVLALRGKQGDFAEVRRLGAAVAANPSLDEGGMMLDALGVASMRECNWNSAAKFFSYGLKVPKRNHSRDFSELYLGLCLANSGRDREALGVLARLASSRSTYVRQRAAESVRIIHSGRARAPFVWE